MKSLAGGSELRLLNCLRRAPANIIRFYQTAAPDRYIDLVGACTANRSLIAGRSLHARIITTGLSLLPRVASKLISFYTECGQPTTARHLFDQIPKQDIRRWVALTGALSRRGHHEEALRLFCDMQRDGFGPDRFVLPSILKSCGQMSDLFAGECLHSLAVKTSLKDDAFITCALVDMYCKCREPESARQVFDEISNKDLAALNAMVSGYVHHGLMKEAMELLENAVEPNLVTWNTVISGFSHKGDAFMVLELFKKMKLEGFEPDIVTWTSVISGFVQSFHIEAAFMTFSQMLSLGHCPNSTTISSLLPAIATTANAHLGKEIHGYAIVTGLDHDIYVSTALIDMYAKCGLLSNARMLFYKMPERTAVSWNSMIFGLANHGYCNEAIDTFIQMEKEDQRWVDHLTFTAALSACSHGGMIELGQSLFGKMKESYGIEPRLEHYAAMVDLLGRAGKLKEAYEFIRAMPIHPDLFVWGALLGACRTHGNIELAEVAARQLSELEPASSASNLLLSGLYTEVGGWRKAAIVKRAIKKRKLRKFLGCSWKEA